jgi:hypothetical protein
MKDDFQRGRPGLRTELDDSIVQVLPNLNTAA